MSSRRFKKCFEFDTSVEREQVEEIIREFRNEYVNRRGKSINITSEENVTCIDGKYDDIDDIVKFIDDMNEHMKFKVRILRRLKHMVNSDDDSSYLRLDKFV